MHIPYIKPFNCNFKTECNATRQWFHFWPVKVELNYRSQTPVDNFALLGVVGFFFSFSIVFNVHNS